MSSNSIRIHIRQQIAGNSKCMYSRAHGNYNCLGRTPLPLEFIFPGHLLTKGLEYLSWVGWELFQVISDMPACLGKWVWLAWPERPKQESENSKCGLSNEGLRPLSAFCAQSSANVHFCGPFGPLSKGNFRHKMTTIVGNRRQLWTSTGSPHLLSPYSDVPDIINKVMIFGRVVRSLCESQARSWGGHSLYRCSSVTFFLLEGRPSRSTWKPRIRLTMWKPKYRFAAATVLWWQGMHIWVLFGLGGIFESHGCWWIRIPP